MSDPGSEGESWRGIPRIFWSFEADAPFAKCQICGNALAQSASGYLIEKALKDGEVLFEHAVCRGCRGSLEGEISQESQARIRAYFEENLDEFAFALTGEGLPDWEACLQDCLVKKRPARPGEVRNVYAICEGAGMAFPPPPFMLCGEALEEITARLSAKTRGFLDGYMGEHFGPPAAARPLYVPV